MRNLFRAYKPPGRAAVLYRTAHQPSNGTSCGIVYRMPELPDIAAYLHALEPRIVGQRLESVRIASAFLLRTVQPPISNAEGRTVRELRRIGKRIAIGMDND